MFHHEYRLSSAILCSLCLLQAFRLGACFTWREKGTGTDCSITCGQETAVSAPTAPVIGNSTLMSYVCAVNGSSFDAFSTGTQIGSLFYVGNVLSCWVYSGNPGGPSSTSHSSWYCLCATAGTEIKNMTGSTAESCSTTCANPQLQAYNQTLSACRQPTIQPACYFDKEYTFGYQNSSSSATDYSCLAVSPISTNTPQTPSTLRADSFQCLCSTFDALSNASLTPNCTTSSFYTSNIGIPTSPSPAPSTLTTTEQQRGSSAPAGTIAGSVVGGVVGAALIFGVVLFAMRRSRRQILEVKVPSTEEFGNAFAKPEAQMSLGQKVKFCLLSH